MNKEVKAMSLKKTFNYATVNRLMLVVMLAAEIIIFANLTPYFLQLENLLPVGREISTLGIVAIGQTLCILTGGFDLSVGGTAALAGVVTGYFCSANYLGLPYGVALLVGMGVVFVIGMINGVLITKIKINPFIATMAMNFILGGIVILVTKQPITVNDPAFKFLGATTLGSINFPLPIIIFVGLYFLFWFILKYTTFGRKIYCTGGNAEAARVAGINVERTTFWTYTLSAVLAGFAGVLLASRIATANPSIGSSYAMESIAAAVLGGTALSGGEGNVWGAFLGVFVTGILSNGLIMLGAPQAWRDVATGVVLIAAVILQLASKKSKAFA
ncbi:ABC transporter permease [Christensenella tenuis]|uniref:ABC transporter permease n=1 Tax=Christensenella tenuis TaxID=2763033 RepID=A0ABR7EDT4_9FIRM|nr:ABC transporter permease [Christensenella tenuis]MBC5647940.1 ABC transporter permease [Christensenella tenuis]